MAETLGWCQNVSRQSVIRLRIPPKAHYWEVAQTTSHLGLEARSDMSEHESTESKHSKQFHFFVDANRYETDKSSLTGAEIKQISGVTPTYQLFLEETGDTPDKQIADSETIVLKEGEHTRHFYAVPPATFGSI
jgi:hypothetical protein